MRPNTPERLKPTFARFALGGPALPLAQDTLPIAERVRAAMMSQFKQVKLRALFGANMPAEPPRVASTAFSGKDESGLPLRDGHQHAYFIPTDDDGDGRIDHVTVYAAQGFDVLECRTFTRLRTLSARDENAVPELELLLIGLGRAEDFRSPLFATAAAWVSATPYLACRYPKLRGTKRDRPEDYATPQVFAAHVLRQEIDRLRERRPKLPAVERIDVLETIGPRRLRAIQFRRFRQKAGDDGGRRPGGAFRITFAGPVPGPLCLGHSSHFGMGLFLPDQG